MDAWRDIKNYVEDIWPQPGSCVGRCDAQSRDRPLDEVYETRRACKEVCHDMTVKSANDCLNRCTQKCTLSGQINSMECSRICVEACQSRLDIN